MPEAVDVLGDLDTGVAETTQTNDANLAPSSLDGLDGICESSVLKEKKGQDQLSERLIDDKRERDKPYRRGRHQRGKWQ